MSWWLSNCLFDKSNKKDPQMQYFCGYHNRTHSKRMLWMASLTKISFSFSKVNYVCNVGWQDQLPSRTSLVNKDIIFSQRHHHVRALGAALWPHDVQWWRLGRNTIEFIPSLASGTHTSKVDSIVFKDVHTHLFKDTRCSGIEKLKIKL